MKSTIIASYVNGKEASTINVTNRGLAFGDGLFETIRYAGNNPCYWDKHWSRLHQGCNRLNIPVPDEWSTLETIHKCARNVSDAVIKIVVTRGETERGYQYPDKLEPTIIITAYDGVEYPGHYATSGIEMIYCQTRITGNPRLAGIKHLNRLEQVLARNEWKDISCQEGLMLDQNDHIIEGTMSNFFAVRDKTLYTPSLNQFGVTGVMRDVVMECAEKKKLDVKIVPLDREAVNDMDELFITNSLITIWPVKKLNDRIYPVGETTKLLQHALKNNIGAEC